MAESLDTVEIVMALEEELDVEFNEEVSEHVVGLNEGDITSLRDILCRVDHIPWVAPSTSDPWPERGHALSTAPRARWRRKRPAHGPVDNPALQFTI